MVTTSRRRPFLSWRWLSVCLILLLCFFVLLSSDATPHLPHSEVLESIGLSKPVSGRSKQIAQFGNWSAWNDAFDGLTASECRSVFPNLYHDIDRAVQWWQNNSMTVTKSNTVYPTERGGVMRFLIYDNEFRILLTQHVMTTNWRIHGFTEVIQRALGSAMAGGDQLPAIEATLNIYDNPVPSRDDSLTLWSVTRDLDESNPANQRVWLMPNFDFWWSQATGSFEDAKRLAMEYDHLSFAEKIPQMVWRGNQVMNPELRGSLLEISKDKPWSDIVQVPGPNMDVNYKRLEHFQYCRYAMTVYTEGQTYSGRLAFLLNCRSLLFLPEVQWALHYSHLLVPNGPGQNYVLVKRDWSDLEDKVQYYLAHPEESDRIIKNMLSVFRSRYTTRAATSCYIRELIKGYAKVSFDPVTHIELYDGEVSMPRGRSWQTFVQKPDDDTDFETRTHVGEK